MLVLAVDTSSAAVSAALVELNATGQLTRAEHAVVDGKRHGELLAVGVRAVLAGARPDAVVVGTGPGPFTGLRVGLVTAAVLASAWGVPVYGVCSLDGYAARDEAVLTDARRREVYWARYDATGARVDGPHVNPPAQAAERLGGQVQRLVGAGAVLHAGSLAGFEVDSDRAHLSVAALVAVAAPRIRAGAPADPITPLYLRRPDATAPGEPKRVIP